jgi:hypothetical protein
MGRFLLGLEFSRFYQQRRPEVLQVDFTTLSI